MAQGSVLWRAVAGNRVRLLPIRPLFGEITLTEFSFELRKDSRYLRGRR